MSPGLEVGGWVEDELPIRALEVNRPLVGCTNQVIKWLWWYHVRFRIHYLLIINLAERD